MSTVFVRAEDAERINRLVQERIDSRLFLFCNYESGPILGSSQDCIFVAQVLELYCFVVDSCCSIHSFVEMLWNERQLRGKEEKDKINGLEADIETIKMLRAALAHAQSDRNGYSSQRIREEYTLWIRGAIGKDTPDSNQDYAVMNSKLEILYRRILARIETMVSLLETRLNREKLVKQWLDIIIQWYCSNTHTEIYFGCLISEYIVRAEERGNTVRGRKGCELRYKVNRWMEASLLYPFDREIKELEERIEGVRCALDPDNGQAAMLWQSLSEQNREKMQYKMRKSKAKDEKRIEEILREKEKIENYIAIRRSRELFYKQLKDDQCGLRSSMQKLDGRKINYSMLPQDLIMFDIGFRFDGVVSPEGDF